MSVSYSTCKPFSHLGRTCNTSKENTHAQVSRKLPLTYGCMCSLAASTQGIICMSIVIAGYLLPRNSVIKIACVALTSLANQPGTRTYVHVGWDVKPLLHPVVRV